jgi:succinate dehydrogenase / fumarate reductase, cytochrome b subunit
MRERPLSPHLSIYRMYRYTLFTSFANRATGIGLSIGLLALVYWLTSVASGPEAYDRAVVVLSSPIFKLFYAGFLIAFVYHLVAGIRHLIWDTGAGLERHQSQRSAWIVVSVSVVLVFLLGYLFFVGVSA